MFKALIKITVVHVASVCNTWKFLSSSALERLKKKVERLILLHFQRTLLKHFLSYGPQKDSGKEASIKLFLEGSTINKIFFKGIV